MTCKDCLNIPLKEYEGTNNECQFCRRERLDKITNEINIIEAKQKKNREKWYSN